MPVDCPGCSSVDLELVEVLDDERRQVRSPVTKA
jgi:hypothetical protein